LLLMRYAIQLASKKQEKKAWQVIYKIKAKQPIRLVKLRNRYRVIIGEYSTIHSAYRALRHLPPKNG